MKGPDKLTDEELLQELLHCGGRLLGEAHKVVEERFGTTKDDSRWQSPIPLDPELQLKHLFVQMLDALDVAQSAFGIRATAVGFGAIRFLAETLALIRWLSEDSNKAERSHRAYRLALRAIRAQRRVLEKAPSADNSTVSALMATEKRLEGIALEEGIRSLKEPPRSKDLFDGYLEPGSVVFSALSEIGSHPGFIQLAVLFRDRETPVINVDLSGNHGERAAWLNAAITLFGQGCDRIGEVLGWDDWRAGVIQPLVQECVPFLTEAKSRWQKRWNIRTG